MTSLVPCRIVLRSRWFAKFKSVVGTLYTPTKYPGSFRVQFFVPSTCQCILALSKN